jgi:hypothetical protein
MRPYSVVPVRPAMPVRTAMREQAASPFGLQNLYTNAIPAAIVIACVYIPLNLALSSAATGLERRNRRRRITPGAAIRPDRLGVQ